MVYGAHPPYEVLQTRTMDFATLSKLRRFAKFWDIFGNSGNFRTTLPRLWAFGSPFQAFLRFSEWLHEQGVKTSGVALGRQYELIYHYLSGATGTPDEEIKAGLARDYLAAGRTDLPPWLAETSPGKAARREAVGTSVPRRQQRHLAAQAQGAAPQIK